MFANSLPDLSKELIDQHLLPDTLNLFDDILIFDEVSSTNDILWERFSSGHRSPTICLAEQQTSGRGRNKNSQWQSPATGNLYLSLFWPYSSEQIEGLSLIIGMSVVATLEQVGIDNLEIKWPNDILFERKKLAGILVESRYQSNHFLVVGLGLNLILPKHTQDTIGQPATSLQELCLDLPDRNQLVSLLINNIVKFLQDFEQHGLTHFLPMWTKYDALAGNKVTLINGEHHTTAIANGINQHGELLYTHNHRQYSLSSSHISIRFAS